MADPLNHNVTIHIERSKMSLDLATVIGLVSTFLLISIAIWIGKSDAQFFNIPAILIVILGTIAVTSVSYTGEELANAWKIVSNSIFRQRHRTNQVARQLMDIALVAKKKGLLSLGSAESELRKDPHLFKAVQFVTDGFSPQEIERVLAQDLDALIGRHRRSASILRRASETAPAMGLIGTLIGLVQMLANLQDPETIGPAMAVALLTTFYGAVLGTAVLAPMAAKLERNSNEEATIRTLVMIAMSSIARQDNPRRLEILLNAELPPEERISYFD